MTLAIRVQALNKIYRTGFWMRPVVGLQQLDLEVEAGEIFGFVGPNGAGKTTTIKILVGLQRATGGSAEVLGQPCDQAASRNRLGFLPERPYFYEHLSARELLHFYGQLYNLPEAQRSRRIDTLLERMALTRFADVHLRKYSKGMLQRVGLCQALLHEPDLLVLDEPMSGLDPIGRALVRQVILEEREAGRTVFFSSHILSDVEELCDRVALLVDGEQRGVGTIEALLEGRIRWMDCVVVGGEQVDLAGEVTRVREGRRWVRIAADQLDSMIENLKAGGGRVVQATPVGATLEELLVDEVERSKSAGDGDLGREA